MQIRPPTTDDAIAACFPLFHVLRPHLIAGEFVARVRRQQASGYHLICGYDGEAVVAAAGFRFLEFLAWGRVLYVDDLITAPEHRQRGHGHALMEWLIARAKEADCDELHLDSGYHRHDAHRLYLNQGLQLTSHHFSRKL